MSPSTMLNIAELAPIPSARIRMIELAIPGVRSKMRAPKRTSCNTDPIKIPEKAREQVYRSATPACTRNGPDRNRGGASAGARSSLREGSTNHREETALSGTWRRLAGGQNAQHQMAQPPSCVKFKNRLSTDVNAPFGMKCRRP